MFDSLSDRFDGIFKRLRGKGRLSEGDVDIAPGGPERQCETRFQPRARLDVECCEKVAHGQSDGPADRPLPSSRTSGSKSALHWDDNVSAKQTQAVATHGRSHAQVTVLGAIPRGV